MAKYNVIRKVLTDDDSWCDDSAKQSVDLRDVEAYVKEGLFDVCFFNGISTGTVVSSTNKVPLSAYAEDCKVIYNEDRKCFIFGVPPGDDPDVLNYYNDWKGSARYGTPTPQGVQPVAGRNYVDLSTSDVYRWQNGALHIIGYSLYDYINNTSQSLSALENKVGKANGIAPLDADKLIPAANIPLKYDNIIFFDSVQDGAIITQPGSALVGADDPKATLIFSESRDRFVLGVAENAGGMPQKYYVNFPGSDRYGTPKYEGIRPASDKVYICRSTSLAYVWNGTTLAALVADYSSEFQNIDADIMEINESIGKANGIAPLTASGVVPNENISDEARKSLFCDLFNAAAGTAGYAKFTNGVWDCKLNGLTLSYDEAVLIYNVTNGSPATEGFAHTNIRTNFWRLNRSYGSGVLTDSCPAMIFYDCRLLEVINVRDFLWVNDMRNMFAKCPKLTEVSGVIGDTDTTKVELVPFPNSPLITSFKLHRLQHNYSFAANPLIDLDSFDYMVTNRVSTNTNNYTVTVHADVYAKLTGDTTNEAAAALTADELSQWQALLTKAAAKHIAFASA